MSGNGKKPIVEVDHRTDKSDGRRDRITPKESGLEERDRLHRQVRRLSERNAKMFDEGFAAAVDMVRRGATLERLEEACGVVVAEWQDTEPVELPTADMRMIAARATHAERDRTPRHVVDVDTQPVDVGDVRDMDDFLERADTDVD